MILLTLSRLTSRQTHQRGPEIEIRTDLCQLGLFIPITVNMDGSSRASTEQERYLGGGDCLGNCRLLWNYLIIFL